MSYPRTDTASCPTCHTDFSGVELDGDESGVYAILELSPCPICTALLCACCSQFQCDSCDQAFCSTHCVSVPDGTEKPMKLCPACAQECELADQLAFFACPECLSQELTATLYEAPRCTETGYVDSQWMYKCHACGSTGPSDDLARMDTVRKQVASETIPALCETIPTVHETEVA